MGFALLFVSYAHVRNKDRREGIVWVFNILPCQAPERLNLPRLEPDNSIFGICHLSEDLGTLASASRMLLDLQENAILLISYPLNWFATVLDAIVVQRQPVVLVAVVREILPIAELVQ